MYGDLTWVEINWWFFLHMLNKCLLYVNELRTPNIIQQHITLTIKPEDCFKEVVNNQ